jgi:hypothetical protein
MTKQLKVDFILFYFILFYFISLLDGIHEYSFILKQVYNFLILSNLIFLFYIIRKCVKKQIIYPSVMMKFFIFMVFLVCYFIIEQLFIKLSMYSIGGSGGWIRNNIYEDIHYIFQWYEVLLWNFIFSLHYPIYIYIFFKPFVNHLDKSIKKIQLDKNTTTTTVL